MRASLILVICLAGCAGRMVGTEVPERAPVPVVAQAHVQAPAQWKVIAADAAAQVDAGLAANGNPSSVRLMASSGSPFDSLFRDFLQEQLLARGRKISAEGTPIAVQSKLLVRAPVEREAQGFFPDATLLATGIAVVRRLVDKGNYSAAIIDAGVAVDAFRFSRALQEQPEPKPIAEVVLTYAIGPVAQPAWARSDVYFVNLRDAGFYRTATATTLPIR